MRLVSRVMTKTETARRLRAYHAMGTDGLAAKRLGLGVVAFRLWRVKQGLPAKAPIGRPRHSRKA